MPSRLTIFRIAAVFIMLLTGIDLIACEVSASVNCEISGETSTQNSDANDSCLCCCSHIVIAPPVAFSPTHEVVALEPAPPALFSSFETFSIYHPPKA